MMNKKKTPASAIVKYALLLPLIAGLLFVNNLQAQKQASPKKAEVSTESKSPVGNKQVQKKAKQGKEASKVSNENKSTKTVPVKDDAGVYKMVEQRPEFPGGMNALMQFIGKNLKYPSSAVAAGIQGRVVCQFIVSAEGKVKDVKVIQGLSPELDAEAVRLIESMPDWIPGEQNGEKVNVYYTIPIRFKLEGKETPIETNEKSSPEEATQTDIDVKTNVEVTVTAYSTEEK